ncbi:MAG: glycogen/starch synthase [Fibromonadaceae bacterium]|jgi:starch synthase|nr:glycogen/starch synthase [Fibromonadaceae bacterium]
MKILVICSESYSASDSSPLTRAVSSIVSAYRNWGAKVLGFSPYFSKLTSENSARLERNFVEKLGNREYSTLRSIKYEDDLFIQYEDYFGRDGIYGDPGEKSYSDNHVRFAFLASAALNYCLETNFKPNAIHVHEWGGIAGALTKTVYKDCFGNIPVVLTTHNICFDYHCGPDDIPLIGLPPEGFDIDGYEFWGKVSMLKAAILYSDKVVFTSSSYLFYLLSSDLQGGMRGFLESQKRKLFSIQSGIDYASWSLPSKGELLFKQQKKEALRAEFGLEQDSSLLMYSHLDAYSGSSAQIISTILANLLNLDLQLAIGISEDNENYSYFAAIQEKHPHKMALLPLDESDESLYQRLAASDTLFSIGSSDPSLSLFLKASAAGAISISNKRSQKPFLYSVPYEPSLEVEDSSTRANSFVSESTSPDLILEQVLIAESIFREKKRLWSKFVSNACSLKVSWTDTAKNYLLLLGSTGL